MTDQSQKATDGSVAIQSKGDVTLNTGMSAADLVQIMSALSEHVKIFEQKAVHIVQERISTFQDKVLKRFAEDVDAKSAAFSDPDFQHVFIRAQHAQARSDDPRIGDTLVDLIVQRSKETQRSRISLSINDAIEKTAVLTANEFAELSIVYLLRYTVRFSIKSLSDLIDYLKFAAFPFLPDISREDTSYQYLESHGCASVSLGEAQLYPTLLQAYGQALSKGIEVEELKKHLPENVYDELLGKGVIVDCKNSIGTVFIPMSQIDDLVKILEPYELDRKIASKVAALRSNSLYKPKEFREVLSEKSGDAENSALLFDLWQQTPLKNINLTTTGIAIAHANLRRVIGFGAPLNIWIK